MLVRRLAEDLVPGSVYLRYDVQVEAVSVLCNVVRLMLIALKAGWSATRTVG
jgi:hypothetical protein